MPDFLLPDLGEGLTEAEIVSWLVDVGDEVRADQPVVEVETAKAVVEVPVPFSGRVTALHGRPGQSLAVGRPLITVGAGTADNRGLREPGVVTGAAVDGGSGGSGNVLIGYGTPASAPGRRRRALISTGREQLAAAGPVAAAADPASPAEAPDDAADSAPAVISPPVRLLAKRAGVDLRSIAGTGPAGVIRRIDVEAAIAAQAPTSVGRSATGRSTAVPTDAARSTATPSSATAPTAPVPSDHDVSGSASAAVPAGPGDDDGGDRRVRMSPTRRYIAEKMTRSRREIPEATVWVDVDATDLLNARSEINRRDPDRPVSVLGFLSRFAVLGLRRYPELNGRVDGNDIVLPAHVQLGFAAQTDRGLVVPVIRAADRLTARELSASIGAAAAAARAGSLSPQDLSGGTFSVNNYGVFGVDGSAAIINHPEVAMLGLGRIIDRPWVVDGQVVPRKIAQLSLVFDHRICDGGVAGGFLRFVADCVESPLGALADL